MVGGWGFEEGVLNKEALVSWNFKCHEVEIVALERKMWYCSLTRKSGYEACPDSRGACLPWA